MPEPYWPKKKGSYTLTDAERNGSYAKMRCRYCKTERFYLLKELRVVFGNVQCDDVTYQRDWRCTNCGNKNTIDLSMETPSAADIQNGKIRRIDRIEYVRRVTWKDEQK